VRLNIIVVRYSEYTFQILLESILPNLSGVPTRHSITGGRDTYSIMVISLRQYPENTSCSISRSPTLPARVRERHAGKPSPSASSSPRPPSRRRKVNYPVVCVRHVWRVPGGAVISSARRRAHVHEKPPFSRAHTQQSLPCFRAFPR